MFMPSSITWICPSPGLSGSPTSGAETLKLDTSTCTGMSVVVMVAPSVGDITLMDGLSAARAGVVMGMPTVAVTNAAVASPKSSLDLR